MVASPCRSAQAASLWGPATFGDHWGWSKLGRKGVADGAAISTSAAGGLRPNAGLDHWQNLNATELCPQEFTR